MATARDLMPRQALPRKTALPAVRTPNINKHKHKAGGMVTIPSKPPAPANLSKSIAPPLASHLQTMHKHHKALAEHHKAIASLHAKVAAANKSVHKHKDESMYFDRKAAPLHGAHKSHKAYKEKGKFDYSAV